MFSSQVLYRNQTNSRKRVCLQIKTANVSGCVETGPDPAYKSSWKVPVGQTAHEFFFQLTILNTLETAPSERCVKYAFTAPGVLKYSICRPAPKKALTLPRECLDVERTGSGTRTSTIMKTPPLNV